MSGRDCLPGGISPAQRIFRDTFPRIGRVHGDKTLVRADPLTSDEILVLSHRDKLERNEQETAIGDLQRGPQRRPGRAARSQNAARMAIQAMLYGPVSTTL